MLTKYKITIRSLKIKRNKEETISKKEERAGQNGGRSDARDLGPMGLQLRRHRS